MLNQTLNKIENEKNKEPLVIERTYNAPAPLVWKAITEVGQMKKWYFNNLKSFKPEVGFKTEVNVHHNDKDYLHLWEVAEVVTGKKIAYSWKYKDQPGDSLVTFELFAEGDKTRIRLTHTGLETFLPESNPDYARSNFNKGWTGFIGSSLKDFVEKEANV